MPYTQAGCKGGLSHILVVSGNGAWIGGRGFRESKTAVTILLLVVRPKKSPVDVTIMPHRLLRVPKYEQLFNVSLSFDRKQQFLCSYACRGWVWMLRRGDLAFLCCCCVGGGMWE